MFTHTHLVVGPMLPKQKMTLEYPYYDIDIISWTTSCGCSDGIDDKLGGKFRVTYTANDIPPHLLDKGGYTTEQYIIIKHRVENSTEEQTLKLTFKATIHDAKRRG